MPVGGFDIRELVEKAKSGLAEVGQVAFVPKTPEEAGLEQFCSNIEQDPSEPAMPSVEEDSTAAFPDTEAFFGQRSPSYLLQEEKPQHRVICYLAAEGNTRNEIAEKTGFSAVQVGYVLKQPWATKRIADLIRQHGGDQVEYALKGAVLDCAQFLIRTVRDPQCDVKVRSSNAKEILDRVYGRAQQVMTHLNLSAEDLSDGELAKAVRGSMVGAVQSETASGTN